MDHTEYLKERENIAEKNLNFVGVVLNDAEKALDRRLSQLKREYKAQYADVPYTMPVLEDEKIWNSGLYDFCMKLPKGSDLHVHGSAILPMNRFMEFLLRREDVCIDINTFILHSDGRRDESCVPLKEAFEKKLVDRDELFRKWTILTAKHKVNKWNYFEDIFVFFEAIDTNYKVLHDYYVEAFEYYVELNVQRAEVHLFLASDEELSMESIRIIRQAYYEVKDKHPEFSAAVIGCGMKMYDVSLEDTQSSFRYCLKAQETIKDDYDPDNVHDFVIGFDLVNEEDTSRPLSEYAEALIDFKAHHPDFEYFLHSGESLDVNSSNLIDAYLIGASRVGHGINLYRYPQLLRAYADREICIEACLLSNKSLGYVKDLRLHPALEYLKREVVIALCSDDPMFFEHETLVDDFFAAIVCWDLNIADIKQLCINSIMYSGADAKTRSMQIKTWTEKWNAFIEDFT